MVAARQEEATVKRIKLEYDEIGSCVREVVEVWDLLVSKESRVSTQCDAKMLLQAIRQGETSDPEAQNGDIISMTYVRQMNKYKIKTI
jgi:TBC1 domain-containing protein 4